MSDLGRRRPPGPGVAAIGTDPATARPDAEGVVRSFIGRVIGRVRDGATEGPAHVPAWVEAP